MLIELAALAQKVPSLKLLGGDASMETMMTRSAFFPLRDAVLCVECEFIAPPGDDKCPVCGRKTLVQLAALLEALIEKACTTHPAIALADLVKLVPLSNSSIHRPIAENRGFST